jgi:hypothetical protein
MEDQVAAEASDERLTIIRPGTTGETLGYWIRLPIDEQIGEAGAHDEVGLQRNLARSYLSRRVQAHAFESTAASSRRVSQER